MSAANSQLPRRLRLLKRPPGKEAGGPGRRLGTVAGAGEPGRASAAEVRRGCDPVRASGRIGKDPVAPFKINSIDTA